MKVSPGNISMNLVFQFKCSPTVKYCLMQNAEESLEHAIAHLTGEQVTVWDYKRAVIDLAHVAELLFKERLLRVHHAFIFENVDKQKNDKTISVTKAIERLQTIAHIEFKDDDKSALETIIKFRNDIIHYEYVFNAQEFQIIIGNILVFLFKFGLDELGLDWPNRRITDKKWLKLNEFASFYEAQKKRLEDELFDSELYIEKCPVCLNEVFDVEAEVCLLCGYREEMYECAQCHKMFFQSALDSAIEESTLCQRCLDLDGYSAANFEKY